MKERGRGNHQNWTGGNIPDYYVSLIIASHAGYLSIQFVPLLLSAGLSPSDHGRPRATCDLLSALYRAQSENSTSCTDLTLLSSDSVCAYM